MVKLRCGFYLRLHVGYLGYRSLLSQKNVNKSNIHKAQLKSPMVEDKYIRTLKLPAEDISEEVFQARMEM